MIAGLFVVTGKDYVALCKQLAKEALESKEGEIAGLAEEDYLTEAERMQQAVDEMNEAVKQHGWDGEWFLRAYDFFGNKIGSDENEEGKSSLRARAGVRWLVSVWKKDSAIKHWTAVRNDWNASTDWC